LTRNLPDIHGELGRVLPEHKSGLISVYVDILEEWNRSIRLTGFHNRNEIYRHLVCEPVLAGFFFDVFSASGPLVDFGSGNGSPGIIFSIMNPDRPVYLVERKLKKRSFLSYLIARLHLEHVIVLDTLENTLALLTDATVMEIWMKAISLSSLAEALPVGWTVPCDIRIRKFGEADPFFYCQNIIKNVINSENYNMLPAFSFTVSECMLSANKDRIVPRGTIR
jgi:16S rRNA (guanine527-N7)-methyltransferase